MGGDDGSLGASRLFWLTSSSGKNTANSIDSAQLTPSSNEEEDNIVGVRVRMHLLLRREKPLHQSNQS